MPIRYIFIAKVCFGKLISAAPFDASAFNQSMKRQRRRACTDKEYELNNIEKYVN